MFVRFYPRLVLSGQNDYFRNILLIREKEPDEMHPLSGKTQAAVVSCNVSYKNSIDAETLVGVLSGLVPATPWQAHLDTFFNELPKEYILGVMQENALPLGKLADVYHSLHPVFQGKNFRELLDERG